MKNILSVFMIFTGIERQNIVRIVNLIDPLSVECFTKHEVFWFCFRREACRVQSPISSGMEGQ